MGNIIFKDGNRMTRRKQTPGSDIANAIIEKYQPKTVEDMQDALKEIFGPMFQAMLNGEMEHHLGYEHNERVEKESLNRRNGYSKKTLKTSFGSVPVDVPRDREATFEPQIIPKHKTDVSAIENKVLAMYARGMSQRDISATIEDIYGFSISHEQISSITDHVLDELDRWQNRPLAPFYPFLFVDCMYVSLHKDYEVINAAVYTILGYNANGEKDILGLWIGDTESKHSWMQIFDELKARGVQDIGFISMDGVSGLEEGAKAIFKEVVVQRCIVHLVRNSIKYVPNKDYKPFTAQLKKIYGAPSLKAAHTEFERFKQTRSNNPGAVGVWERNFKHVEQLFNYGSAVRKIMYTTNAIESVNSSFRKVTKKGSFPNENAVMKLLYLRIQELYKKWNKRTISGWAMVRNQLLLDKRMQPLFEKYDRSF